MRLKQQKNSIYFGGRTAFHYKYAIAVCLSVCEKKQECKNIDWYKNPSIVLICKGRVL